MIIAQLLLACTAMCLVIWFSAVVRAVARAKRAALEQLGSRDLADLFIFLDGQALARAVSVALLVMPMLLFLLSHSAVLSTALAGAMLLLPSWIVKRLRQRRLRKLERSLPDALFALASLMKAGAGLGGALAALPEYLQRPLADEVILLVRQMRMGVPLQQAVRQWAERVATTEARAFASLLSVVHGHGGTLAPALEQLAGAARRRLAMEDRIDALTSQGRLQAIVVTLLPLGVAAVLWQLDPQSMRPLLHTVRGLIVSGVVVVLLGTGWWGIRRVVDIRV